MLNLTAINQDGNKVSIGVSGGKTRFEADGTPVFEDSATNWNDLNLSINSLAVGATAPANWTITGTSLVIKAFSGSGPAESAHGSLEILHDYKEGSDITPHIHWCPTTTASGDVRWQLEYAWVDNGTISTSTTIGVTVAANGVVGKEARTNFPAISGTGRHIGSRFVFRLFRDPAHVADTYGDAAGAFDFGIHYERDTIGSRLITTK